MANKNFDLSLFLLCHAKTLLMHLLYSFYRSKTYDDGFKDFDQPFEFAHKPLGWLIRLDFKKESERYSLEINDVKYEEMTEAPPRERAALARTAITMKTDGPKKSVRFGLMRKGEYIGVSAVYNTHTKFAKL